MIDKLKAIELRKEGKTYKEIASELGCSEIWCKTNLKGITKNAEFEKSLQKCIEISKSRNGITTGEILKIMENSDDFWKNTEKSIENRKKLLRKVKQKIKNEKGLVRPMWMIPEESQESFKAMIEIVNSIDQKIYEEILYYREQFNLDPSYDKSILVAISQLTQVGAIAYGNAGITSICEAYEQTAFELAKKRNKAVALHKKKYSTDNVEQFSDLEQFMD